MPMEQNIEVVKNLESNKDKTIRLIFVVLLLSLMLLMLFSGSNILPKSIFFDWLGGVILVALISIICVPMLISKDPKTRIAGRFVTLFIIVVILFSIFVLPMLG